VLKKVIKEQAVSTVYLAVSSIYNDPVVLQKLRDFMVEQKVQLFVGSERLKTLQNITDNYYLSLIEQEICSKSQTFIWSSDSTWSDFIVNHNDQVNGSLVSISFAKLLKANKLPFSTWNRVRDVPKLNLFKRDRNTWRRPPPVVPKKQ